MDDTGVARATMRRLEIATELDLLAGADAGFGEKPGTGMVLAFCDADGLQPAEVMVVGDTPADLVMAGEAGCAMVVAVSTGALPLPRMAGLASHVLPSVQEIETLL